MPLALDATENRAEHLFVILAAALIVCVQSAAMDVQRHTIEREPFPAEDSLDHERLEIGRIGTVIQIGLGNSRQRPLTSNTFWPWAAGHAADQIAKADLLLQNRPRLF